MGITKTEIFTNSQNELAKIAKALAHPARIAILQQVFKSESCICGDLVGEIGLAQPTISQHLKELKSAGILKGTVEGTRVCYCVDMDVWQRNKRQLSAFLDLDLANTETCC